MRFRYFGDPVFLMAAATYLVNAFVLKKILPSGFVHSSVNDLLCIPFCVPIMLYLQRKVGMRDHDRPPEPHEIGIPLVIWAALFEIVLPAIPGLGDRFVADPVDVVCYSAGALAAAMVWRRTYRRPAAWPCRMEMGLGAAVNSRGSPSCPELGSKRDHLAQRTP